MTTKLLTYERFIDREIHEHEVFLSFVNDRDAELFEQWMDDFGEHLFTRYLEQKASDIDWGIDDN